MKSILDSRIFYHWRLARRGGAYLAASLLAAAGAGFFAGAARPGANPAIHLAPVLGLAGFVALVLVTGLLWWRFSSFQDEMFHRIQNYSYGWGAAVTVAILVVWGIANAVSLAPPIDPLAPLLLFAVIKLLFWSRAVRTWL